MPSSVTLARAWAGVFEVVGESVSISSTAGPAILDCFHVQPFQEGFKPSLYRILRQVRGGGDEGPCLGLIAEGNNQ